MKYIKKPIPVDAWQIDMLELIELKYAGNMPQWVGQAYRDRHINTDFHKNELNIFTLEGKMTASEGDYLIKGPKGEYWFNKREIFEEMYEAVDE